LFLLFFLCFIVFFGMCIFLSFVDFLPAVVFFVFTPT